MPHLKPWASAEAQVARGLGGTQRGLEGSEGACCVVLLSLEGLHCQWPESQTWFVSPETSTPHPLNPVSPLPGPHQFSLGFPIKKNFSDLWLSFGLHPHIKYARFQLCLDRPVSIPWTPLSQATGPVLGPWALVTPHCVPSSMSGCRASKAPTRPLYAFWHLW